MNAYNPSRRNRAVTLFPSANERAAAVNKIKALLDEEIYYTTLQDLRTKYLREDATHLMPY